MQWLGSAVSPKQTARHWLRASSIRPAPEAGAHGVAGRFLVSIGERSIRRMPRFPLDMAAVIRSTYLPLPTEVRIIDLSSSGARVEGVSLPVGSDVEVVLTPPNRPLPMVVVGFVVRVIDASAVPTIGVAFRLVQPALEAPG